jgi:hypothetical protein
VILKRDKANRSKKEEEEEEEIERERKIMHCIGT